MDVEVKEEVTVSQMSVSAMAEALLEIARPLAAFDMPLLDAHGATLAEDIYAGERLVLRKGSRIRSTQIGLAASIGLSRLPTQPHPRVVVISAGDDLVEPGQDLTTDSEEFEANSWMLTTAVKEAGAMGYRVHAIPENHDQLKAVIEDQLVRADLIVISGESHDGSVELIEAVLRELGTITSVIPGFEGSARHNFGTIGEDKVPVLTLPGDTVAAFLSCELFIRPMIRRMLGAVNIYRPTIKATISTNVESPIGLTSLVRATLSATGEDGARTVTPLPHQDQLYTLSDAHALIAIPADSPGALLGEVVDVLVLDRQS
jgi:molybdopterin biosynthesis enzyme